MELTAKAKINLGLEITEILPDGYHSLFSIFHEIPLSDRLTLQKTDTPGIRLSCSDPALSCGEDNLCYRAAKLVYERFLPGEKSGLSVFLEKNIPMQAGLGGGSSDAAAVIRGMKALFMPESMTEEAMKETAAALGADVPFFLTGGCMLVKGKGEAVRTLPSLSGFFLVLARPKDGCDTGKVYRHWDELAEHRPVRMAEAVENLMRGDYPALFSNLGNALEESAADFVPEIAHIRKELMENGAQYAAMTGSGSCVFGLFGTEEKAKDAALSLSDRFWTWTGRMQEDC